MNESELSQNNLYIIQNSSSNGEVDAQRPDILR